MTGVVSAALGAEAVPGQVFRSELNPVDFLHREVPQYRSERVHVERSL